MKIKVIIAEDEVHSLQRLKTLLAKYIDTIEIIGEAVDGQSAVEMINEKKPDLIFLDIQMPVLTGFEVISKLTYQPSIIFVTAYDNYAVEAFESNGIDYLLKPTSQERLDKTIERIKALFMKEKGAVLNPQIMDLLSKLGDKTSKKYLKKFTVKDGDDILLLPESEICYFKTEDKYLFLCTYGREYIYNSTLKELIEELDEAVFIRIHKSFIININRIFRIKKNLFRDYCIEIDDDRKNELKIGRNYMANVKKILRF